MILLTYLITCIRRGSDTLSNFYISPLTFSTNTVKIVFAFNNTNDEINLCSQVVNNLKNILLILNNIFFKLPYY
jgi:hypothetical protein